VKELIMATKKKSSGSVRRNPPRKAKSSLDDKMERGLSPANLHEVPKSLSRAHSDKTAHAASKGASPSKRMKIHAAASASSAKAAARSTFHGKDAMAAQHRSDAAAHKSAGERATVMKGAASRVQGAGKKAVRHMLQQGKHGGTFYLSEGKKVYAKK
jgi:hypothetical protein